MWFGDSKTRTRRRRNIQEEPRPSFLRVNTSLRDRRGVRTRVMRVLLVLVGLVVAGTLVRFGTRLTGRALLSQNDLFRITEYRIKCCGDVIKPGHVMEYASLNTCSNLFAVNIETVRERLLSTVPRVKDVEISRILPGVLAIEVWERTPMARLRMDGYYMTVDRDGYVLGPSSGSRPLPVIAGHCMAGLKPGVFLGGTPVINALEVLDVCETTPIGQVVGIASCDVGDSAALELRLIDGARVKLAWEDMDEQSASSRKHLERKLVKLADNLKEAAARGERIIEIDMTVDKNFPATCARKE